ncbi:MAG: hypothetical protein LBI57_03855 [Helicobacteraceae bacterium]|jgi:hypothetical protein|nr:hypothetical protein [Helicobacteraceae bacterium]
MRAVPLIFALAIFGFAHKLNLFVTDENATLFIRSYFTKSAPCRECEVWIFDKNGKEIAKTKTDGNGEAAIAVAASNVVARVNGGMGHQVEIDYELTGEFDEEIETPLWLSLMKGALGTGIIALFFASLWLIKRKNPSPSE